MRPIRRVVIAQAGNTANTRERAALPFRYMIRYACAHEVYLAVGTCASATPLANTVRNANSSRFGKYVQLHFTPGGKIHDASVQTFAVCSGSTSIRKRAT